MEDFKITPPVEWLEEAFDRRQNIYRRDAEEIYGVSLTSGMLEYRPFLLSYKTDMCSCTDGNVLDFCTALATEGANSADDHHRLRHIDEEISNHAIAQ